MIPVSTASHIDRTLRYLGVGRMGGEGRVSLRAGRKGRRVDGGGGFIRGDGEDCGNSSVILGREVGCQ